MAPRRVQIVLAVGLRLFSLQKSVHQHKMSVVQVECQGLKGVVEQLFFLYASADIYFAIGTAPDATSGTRRFLPANTAVDIFGDRAGGEKVAWIMA
jgi:hypothetical protein